MRPGGTGKKKAGGKSLPETTVPPLLTRRGWRYVGLGAAVTVAGYFVLSHTDAAGRNLASVAAPVLILAGYGLLAFGTIAREKA